MKALLVAIALFYVGRRLGRAAFGALRLNLGRGAEAFVFETGAGLWLVSLIVFAAGAAGAGSPRGVAAALACLLLAVAAGHGRDLLTRGRVKTARGTAAPAPDAFWQWALLAAVACAALVALVRCYAPETNFDALAYHLAVPKAYLQAGRIEYLPTLLYSNFPQTVEMLFMAVLAFGAPEAAALAHAGFGLLTAVLIYALAARTFSPAAGAVAAAVFYLNPLVGLESPAAMVDLAAAFYSAGAVLLVVAPDGAGDRASRTAAGALFAGIALSVKWSCFPVVVLCAGWWLWDAWRARRHDASRDAFCMKRLAILACLCVLPAAVYLIKNWVLTGNPIWPKFGGRDMPALLADAVMAHIGAHGGAGPRSLINFLRLPWDMTRDEWSFGGAMGPVFMTFAPLYALVPRDRTVSRLLLFSVLYIPLWYLGLNQSIRLLLPVFPLLSIAAAYVLLKLCSPAWLRTLAALALAAHLGFGALGQVAGESGLLSEAAVLTGRESRGAYLMRTGEGSGYEAIHWVNRNAAPGDKVLLGEVFVNGYYLDVPYVWGHPLFQGRYEYGRMRHAGDLAAALRSDGVTLIVFRRNAETLYSADPQLPAMGPDEIMLWKEFLARRTCIAFAGRRDTVVRMAPAAGPGRACAAISGK